MANTQLSQKMRDYAFRRSETSYGRWIPLVMADRVGVIEGIISDIRQKRFPSIIKKQSVTGLLSYSSKRKLIAQAVIGTLVTTGAITLLVLRNRKKAKTAEVKPL